MHKITSFFHCRGGGGSGAVVELNDHYILASPPKKRKNLKKYQTFISQSRSRIKLIVLFFRPNPEHVLRILTSFWVRHAPERR